MTPTLAPYLSAGGRSYLTKTTVTGDASGEVFGENQETATLWGGYFALGLDWQLGPGAILFAVQTGIASMNGTLIKNNGAGAINLTVG